MPKQAAPLEKAQAQIEKIARELGDEFIDIELVKESTGRFLRVYADKEGGITLDDLEILHRRIQPLVEDIDYDYMEVSSPGADRPLKTEKDFIRHQGEAVEVHLYRAEEGGKRFIGNLTGLIDGCVVIEDESGEKRSFEMKKVSLVKPYIVLDEEDLENETDEKGGDDSGI